MMFALRHIGQTSHHCDQREQHHYAKHNIISPTAMHPGKIIAIINRNNDIEHKWIVAPEGIAFTREEIAELTHFQEKYFESTITLLYKQS